MTGVQDVAPAAAHAGAPGVAEARFTTDRATLARRLRLVLPAHCLLTDEEMAFGEAAWVNLTDPLPAWHDDHDHNHHGDHPGDVAGTDRH